MPTLFIFAGPNGSGKSFLSDHILKHNYKIDQTSFDYDLEFEKIWASVNYNPSIEAFSKERTNNLFEERYKEALRLKKDFAFQTNYHMKSDLLQLFKKAGFRTVLVYFFVDKISSLETRVAYRYEEKKLHFVPLEQIKERYVLGVQNINATYMQFDSFIMMDNSKGYLMEEPDSTYEPIVQKEGDELYVDPKCSIVAKKLFPFLNSLKS